MSENCLTSESRKIQRRSENIRLSECRSAEVILTVDFDVVLECAEVTFYIRYEMENRIEVGKYSVSSYLVKSLCEVDITGIYESR